MAVNSPTRIASDLQLASALRIATMRLVRRLRVEKSDESLTLTQLSALASIDRHGPLSPTALAERERVQPPSMTRVIAVLEERGYVARTPHPTDRRQSVITATPAGHDLLAEDRRRREAWLARALEGLEEHERAALRAAVPIIERLGNA